MLGAWDALGMRGGMHTLRAAFTTCQLAWFHRFSAAVPAQQEVWCMCPREHRCIPLPQTQSLADAKADTQLAAHLRRRVRCESGDDMRSVFESFDSDKVGCRKDGNRARLAGQLVPDAVP